MSSPDPHIRERLARAADPISFDVDERLEAVHSRSRMRQRNRRAATVLLALAVAASGVGAAWVLLRLGPDQGPAATGGPAGRIAYSKVAASGDEFDYDIYTALAEGAEVREAVTDPDVAYAPVWSPDGTRFAFLSIAGGGSTELWVANEDGTEVHRLSEDLRPSADSAPAWSPDGTRIAFVGTEEGGEITNPVWVVHADGSGAEVVVPGNWSQVAWSSDGSRLAVTGISDSGADFGLWVVRADGSGLDRIAGFDSTAAFPSWSPDGTRIALMVLDPQDPGDYRYDVVVVDVDSGGENPTEGKIKLRSTVVTEWEGFDGFPVWSPDGEWILFSSDREATEEQLRMNQEGEGWFGASLYLMRPDGSDVRMIVPAGEASLLPSSWVD
jgi:Tol biopolymer transport system component